MKINILIISYNSFPSGDAGSLREYAIGKIIASLGHTVFFVGMGKTPCYDMHKYREFQYVSLRINQNQTSIIKKLGNYFRYRSRLKNFIHKYIKTNEINAILVVEIPLNALLFVKQLAKKNGIKLIHDSVEWYSPEEFKLGKFAPAYISKDLKNRFFIDKSFKVIAISKFLENHFLTRGIDSVRIPVILDINDINCEKKTQKDKLTILYAGSPVRKDYLKEIIEGIASLEEELIKRIDFRIIGVSESQLIESCLVSKEAIERLGNSLVILGRVPRECVLKNLEQADFTVLLRSSTQRYAKAGFPTKVVESLASGTPVICNITSDLGDYIHDGENGIVVEKCSAEAFSNAIRNALSLTYDQRKEMYHKARKCAEVSFDYRKYKGEISMILKK